MVMQKKDIGYFHRLDSLAGVQCGDVTDMRKSKSSAQLRKGFSLTSPGKNARKGIFWIYLRCLRLGCEADRPGT